MPTALPTPAMITQKVPRHCSVSPRDKITSGWRPLPFGATETGPSLPLHPWAAHPFLGSLPHALPRTGSVCPPSLTLLHPLQPPQPPTGSAWAAISKQPPHLHGIFLALTLDLRMLFPNRLRIWRDGFFSLTHILLFANSKPLPLQLPSRNAVP